MYGQMLVFGNPDYRLPAIDRLEGYHPGRRSLYRRVLAPVTVGESVKTGLGLHGHWQQHQATKDCVRPLASRITLAYVVPSLTR